MTNDRTDGDFVAKCICGWSIARNRRVSNLPAESNQSIVESVGEMHATRPRFGDKANEEHEVVFEMR